MVNILICDDNEKFIITFRSFLEKDLESRKTAFLIKTAVSSAELCAALERNEAKPDIIFMDIDFGASDGIELTKKINAAFPKIKIIYVTSYTEYATRIYNSKFANFVTKPLNESKVSTLLDNVLKEIETQRNSAVPFSVNNKTVMIYPEELCYIESMKRKAVFHYIDRTEDIYCKTAELSEKLGKNFVLCHRSYIVHLRYIKEITATTVELYSNDILPVSRSRAAELKAAYLEYISKI